VLQHAVGVGAAYHSLGNVDEGRLKTGDDGGVVQFVVQRGHGAADGEESGDVAGITFHGLNLIEAEDHGRGFEQPADAPDGLEGRILLPFIVKAGLCEAQRTSSFVGQVRAPQLGGAVPCVLAA
jgi:hypothetical protein